MSISIAIGDFSGVIFDWGRVNEKGHCAGSQLRSSLVFGLVVGFQFGRGG